MSWQGLTSPCQPQKSGLTSGRTAETPYLSNDTLSIVPSRPETHALLQALTSNSTEIATGIWNEIGHGPAHLARYASADVNDDPWVSVAVGVLMLRLGWLRDNDYWLEGLAQQHPWLADASILAAHQRLAQTPPDVDGAIKHLQQARRVGAVYFFEANRLQGDLLVALAADAPRETHRQLAGTELTRWRTNLANQVQVGAFFSWLMTHGARSRGSLDQRYSTILDSGRLAVQTRRIDDLSALTVLEAAELAKTLEAKWPVSAVTVGATSTVEKKIELTVMLVAAGEKTIEVVKEVRAITGLGLKEARDLVEGAPKPVKEGVSADEAEKVKAQLEKAGAKVEVRQVGASSAGLRRPPLGASKMPSMTALLGLLAIAGYQNRDKIAEMLKGAGATGDKPGSGTQPGRKIRETNQ